MNQNQKNILLMLIQKFLALVGIILTTTNQTYYQLSITIINILQILMRLHIWMVQKIFLLWAPLDREQLY